MFSYSFIISIFLQTKCCNTVKLSVKQRYGECSLSSNDYFHNLGGSMLARIIYPGP
ncbi:hypothetical protein PR048_008758 [Dryococelus australis]|uniref:Uncharacterized protein n=1 Tax=Dryococelus australis TaxID=614101 RepID=A0ABQ9HY06_9NEOP|nr:hypothetical protein PR048_008758 [Dryococelus australis]